MSTPEQLAGDPSVSPGKLSEIAYYSPELQPVIAENPAAQQDLLDWMAQWGTPEGKEAAMRRLQGAAAAQQGEPKPTSGPQEAVRPVESPDVAADAPRAKDAPSTEDVRDVPDAEAEDVRSVEETQVTEVMQPVVSPEPQQPTQAFPAYPQPEGYQQQGAYQQGGQQQPSQPQGGQQQSPYQQAPYQQQPPYQQGGPSYAAQPPQKKKKSLLWLWILLGVVAVVIIGVVIALVASRGPADEVAEEVVAEEVIDQDEANPKMAEETEELLEEDDRIATVPTSPVGNWTAVEIQAGGVTVAIDDLDEAAAQDLIVDLVLNEDGTFLMTTPDTEESGTWEELGPYKIRMFLEVGDGVDVPIEDGRLIISDEEEGFKIVFVKQ